MFVELKCKSNFSFLRGASDARDYIKRASELSMPAIAITDINGVYGIPRAYEATRIYPDVKLIVGAELTISEHPSITLLAQDRAAYGLLCRMITQLHAGKEKGQGFLSFPEFTSLLSSNPQTQGLIAIADLTPKTNLGALKDLFHERLYLPLCQYLDGLDEKRVAYALNISKRYAISLLATNDVHYHAPFRHKLQDCLTCIREGVTLKTAGKKLFKNGERYLKSPLEMKDLFRDLPEALHSSLEISERCRFSLAELQYIYPLELVPLGHTPDSYLEELVHKGAHEIYRGIIPLPVQTQIQKELKLIKQKKYASYFLTVYDIVQFARSQDIICQGRGSAANSIICYCLGVTAIDPIHMNLLFERFMSEERNEPPDIDIDFEHERREEVLQYVYRRYGRDRAAMICAVRTYQRKSSFLELSKVFGIQTGVMTANALLRDFKKIAGSHEENPDAKLNTIEELSAELEDFPRHLSIHSGGFTLSQDPITLTVPIEPARMENRTIIQWDKNDLDTVGLLKLDLLSLGFLAALHKCCNYLGRDWRTIPIDDPETYAMIQRAETEGCFQIESRGQKAMLPRTRPQNFYDLVVQVAIVRPGPNMGEMIKPYLKRREASRRGIPYVLPDSDLEPALGRTYGIPIFQEQIMKVAIIKGGFTPGEADELRRAIASWRSAQAVETMATKLYERLLLSGLSKAWADELFGYFKGYAHYGFPESHAASFASIAYASAYLKRHHPAEFLCAMINSQPLGFYSIDTLINEAKRNGVKVLPIHPNLSDWDAKMESKDTVRMGFRNVRRIKEEDIRWMNKKNEREVRDQDISTKISQTQLNESFFILEVERKREPFHDLYDFIKRTRFNRDVIELMAMADVFSCFGHDQRHSFWQSLEYHNYYADPARLGNSAGAQLSLFTKDVTHKHHVPQFQKMTLYETICADYRAHGYSVHGNPMGAIRQKLPHLPKLQSNAAKKLDHGTTIRFAGILTVLQRPPTAKGVAFITLEDEVGSLDFLFKKQIFERHEDALRNDRFFILQGKIQNRGAGICVLVEIAETFMV